MEMQGRSLRRVPSRLQISQLPTVPSGMVTPPISTPPCTPPWQGDPTGFVAATARRRMLRRNSSLSSISSIASSSSPDDHLDELEWTAEELGKVSTAYADMVEQASMHGTPFVGPPPSQLTHNVARSLCRDQGWRHTMRGTRGKILELVKDDLQWQMDIEATPVQPDPEATPRRSKRLLRQRSMDVLPARRDNQTLAKLSGKLRGVEPSPRDKLVSPYHPRHMTISSGSNAAFASTAYPSPMPSPARQSRLTRTTSMSTLGTGHPSPLAVPTTPTRPATLGRTHSATYASFEEADPSLHGLAPRPSLYTPPLGAGIPLSTPFEPGFVHGMRPNPSASSRRLPLHRTMSYLTLSKHDEDGSESPASSLSSDRGSYFSSVYSGSPATTAAPSMKQRDSNEGFLEPRYGMGLGRRLSRSSLRSMTSSESMRLDAPY